jgi:hypothetical protein
MARRHRHRSQAAALAIVVASAIVHRMQGEPNDLIWASSVRDDARSLVEIGGSREGILARRRLRLAS